MGGIVFPFGPIFEVQKLFIGIQFLMWEEQRELILRHIVLN